MFFCIVGLLSIISFFYFSIHVIFSYTALAATVFNKNQSVSQGQVNKGKYKAGDEKEGSQESSYQLKPLLATCFTLVRTKSIR